MGKRGIFLEGRGRGRGGKGKGERIFRKEREEEGDF